MEGFVAILLLIGLPLFLILFPGRPKYYCEDESKLREDAQIIRVIAGGEGSQKHRRIRTHVWFDDGFEYSACCYSQTGLFEISANKEQQLKVVKAARKKHAKVIKSAKETASANAEFYFENNNDDVDDAQTSEKCGICNRRVSKLTYCTIKDNMGTRYRDICDDCIKKYKAIPKVKKNNKAE